MTDNDEYFKRRTNTVCIDSGKDHLFSLDDLSNGTYKISSDVYVRYGSYNGKDIDKEINNGDAVSLYGTDGDFYFYDGKLYKILNKYLSFPEFPPLFFHKVHEFGFLINYEKLGINVNDVEIKWHIPPKCKNGYYQYMPRYIATISFKHRDMDFTIHFRSIEFPFINEDDIRKTISKPYQHYQLMNEGDNYNFICDVKSSTYSSFTANACHDGMIIVCIIHAGKGPEVYTVKLS